MTGHWRIDHSASAGNQIDERNFDQVQILKTGSVRNFDAIDTQLASLSAKSNQLMKL